MPALTRINKGANAASQAAAATPTAAAPGPATSSTNVAAKVGMERLDHHTDTSTMPSIDDKTSTTTTDSTGSTTGRRSTSRLPSSGEGIEIDTFDNITTATSSSFTESPMAQTRPEKLRNSNNSLSMMDQVKNLITSATDTLRTRPAAATPATFSSLPSKETKPAGENRSPQQLHAPSPQVTAREGTPRPMKVLFLSSDTGGGHRASAESLGKQFQLLFPGTTYDLLDIVDQGGVPPYSHLVSTYKHLSAHPTQWKVVYNVSNSRAFEMMADMHLKIGMERSCRRAIQSYNPDVVVSVHPLMTNVPVLSCNKISNETGRHLPIFTVVTDLGSAHCLWFANGVEKMFVGSEQVKALAKQRGKVPDEKLFLLGLPIRHDFAVQAELMGERWSPAGQAYQRSIREKLELPCTDRKTLLVMGGGEGVGSLANIVDALYVELVAQGIDTLILVVCGRNDKLKNSLATRDWPAVYHRWSKAKERHGLSSAITGMLFSDACFDPLSVQSTGCIESGTVTGSIRKMLSTGNLTLSNAISTPLPVTSEPVTTSNTQQSTATNQTALTSIAENEGEEKKVEGDRDAVVAATTALRNSIIEDDTETIPTVAHIDSFGRTPGNVQVIGLGFIDNMAEFMVAADILVSKAGPGTISEAASLSLPVMLTSFLPGQEEGNVDFVIDHGFGAYISDADPLGIAEETCVWLQDEAKLRMLSQAAKAQGMPYAARDIAKVIGESTLKWMEHNEERNSGSPVAVSLPDDTVATSAHALT